MFGPSELPLESLTLVIPNGPTLAGQEYRDVALVAVGIFHTGEPALRLYATDDEGTPQMHEAIAHVNVSLGDPAPVESRFAVKDYSENAGMADWLRGLCTFDEHGERIPWVTFVENTPGYGYGFVSFPVLQAHPAGPIEALLNNARDAFGERPFRG